MVNQQKLVFKQKISDLLSGQKSISVHDIAVAMGFLKLTAAQRKSIQRALGELVIEGLLKPKGNLKSRVYVLSSKNKNTESVSSEIINTENLLSENQAQKIPFSKKSLALLKYLSKKQSLRSSCEYQIQFLKSYIPNKSFYLSLSDRKHLQNLGKSENQIRPAGTYARLILNRLLIELSWNSSRLEGNTYSLLETQKLIESGQAVGGKNTVETQMILNHKAAIEYIIELSDEKKITSHHIYSIHTLLADGLLANPRSLGRIRNIAVGIGGSNYKPLNHPDMLKNYFELFISKMNLIKDPFEQSIFSLIHLPYLQAFEDVNKRTSRLVANISLFKHNLRPLSFVDVEQDTYVKALLGVYEKNDINLIKDLYMWAYHRSSQKYSAVQQDVNPPDPLKIKHRDLIQNIIRTLILEKIPGADVVPKIRYLIKAQNLLKFESDEIFKFLEIEVYSLHDGNIARFKIRPSEFQAWKKLQ